MEKAEITVERPIYGRALPPLVPNVKARIGLAKFSACGLEVVFCLLGFFWGNTTVFQILNPLGLAYLSAFLMGGTRFYPIAIAVVMGLLWGGLHRGAKYILCLIFCLAFHWGVGSRIKNPTSFLKALFGGLATVLGGVAFAAINGGSIFYFWVAIVEGMAVFLLALVVQKGVVLLEGGLKRKIMTGEELISLALLFGGAVAGTSDMILPLGQIPLMTIPAAVLILTAGYRGGTGAGASAGILVGFLLAACGKADLELFCALSLGGMFCGAMKELGRLAAVFSFLAAVVMLLFYENHELLELSFVEGLAIGSVIFLFLPKKAFAFINTYAVYEREYDEDKYFIKMKEMTEDKLKQFSQAFNGLAKTFRQEKKEKMTGKKNISAMVDAIADRACKNCGLAAYCWDTDFYNTYQMTFSALSVCERRGSVGLNHFPKEFDENCVRFVEFVDTINRIYENFQTKCIWENRLEECRELVSQQLFAVGHIMEDLSGQLDVRGIYQESLEKEIAAALDKENIHIRKVSVLEGQQKNQGGEVTLTLRACNGNSFCNERIVPLVGKVLGKPMRKAGGKAACYGGRDKLCTLRLVEENKFRLTAAVASRPKEEGGVSGDSTAFLETATGSAIMALSDGMGTGKGANSESRSAIELLEQFMEAGFEKDLAVKMINSVLLLRSAEESYATLDICTVDLYNAKAEFMKIGAVAAYILRGERVIAIRSQTLPVGILQHIAPDKNDMLLKDGDIILLMTDGITDAIGGQTEDVQWLADIFRKFHSNNPQDIADYILMEAEKRTEGKRKDDMTVMAGRFWTVVA